MMPEAVDSNGNFEKLRPIELMTSALSVPRSLVFDLHYSFF